MRFDYELIRHFEGTHFTTFFISINHRLYHWHSDFEVLLLIEGSVIVNTAQKQYELNKDDLFLINQNEIHSLARTKENNTILAIQFDPKFCKSYFPKLQRLKFLVRQIKRNEYPDLWEDLRKSMTDIVMDYFRKETGYQLKLMSTLNMLIYRLLRDLQYEIIDEDRLFTENKNLARLNRIINCIQNNYTNKISLKDLAENENLDMYYLSHFIKKQLGISFQEYVNKIRLEKALDLITHTSKTHLDICIECGFSDYRYLSKLFLKEYGCTPLRYKSEYKDLHPIFLSADYGEQHRFMDKNEALDKFIQYLNK
jgi:AraC-like DNA-binding protein